MSFLQKISLIFAVSCFSVLLGRWWINNTNRALFGTVPQGAIAILDTPDIDSLVYRLPQTDYWRDWLFTDVVGKLDRTLSLNDTLLGSFQKKKPKRLVASLHLINANDYDYLLLFEKENLTISLDSLMRLWKAKGITIQKRRFRKTEIYEMNLDMMRQTFTIAQDGSLLLCSSNPVLVDEALSQKHQWFGSNGFWRKTWFSDKSGDLLCYINTNKLTLLSDVFINAQKIPETLLDQINEASDWIQLNLQLQKNNVKINGTAGLRQNNKFITALLSRSSSSQNTLAAHVPFDVMFWVSGNDRNLPQFLKGQADSDLPLKNNFYQWMGNEWGFGFGEPTGADYMNESFILFSAKDTAKAHQTLQSFKPDSSKMSLRHGNHILYPLNGQAIAQLLLSDKTAHTYTSSYYTILNQTVVIAAQLSYLKTFVEKNDARALLAHHPPYIACAKSFQDNNNLTIYIQPEHSKNLLKAIAGNNFGQYLTAKFDYYRRIGPISLQLDRPAANVSIKGEIGYTGEKSSQPQNVLLWNAQLDALPIGKPFVVPVSGNSYKEVFIQDINNSLYLIGKNGKVLWKKAFDSPIMGNVYPTDFYRNGTYYYLFNTQNSVYLIDHEGQNVLGYPLKLSEKANAGLALIDFEGDNNYKFYIPCGQNKIYGYEYSGRPLPLWNPKSGLGLVSHPLIYIKHKDQKYLVAAGHKGDIFLINKDGGIVKKISLGSPLVNAPQAYWRDGQPYIICTAQNSKTYFINLLGEFSAHKYINMSFSSNFAIADICDDTMGEKIFMSNNKVYAYGRLNRIFDITFAPEELPSQVFPIRLYGSKYDAVGVYSQKAGKLFLLNGQGKFFPGFPLNASTPFAVADLLGTGDNILVAGDSGNSIYAYKIQR